MTTPREQAPAELEDPIAAYQGRQVWVDGSLTPAAGATVSVFDHGVLYGDGVFEGIRIYHGRVLKLATHLKRLFESAKSIKLNMPYTAEQLFDATKQTVAANGMDDGYIRLVVTRGPGTLGIDPVPCPRPSVFIIVAPLKLYPQQYYDEGLKLISSSFVRTNPQALSPRIKSLNYLNNILAKTEALEAGVFEAVMYNDQGYVAEATADNLFVVTPAPGNQGKPSVVTPPLSAGCLEGVTRNLVIDLARQAGFDVREDNLTRHDLYTAYEMFLTGTGAEVIPVVDLDARQIGPTGKPGPVTQQLITAFREMVKDAPED